MIGYIKYWDGIEIDSDFGHNNVSIQRSVTPSRVRILGGSNYDLDGMYTYASDQQYTAAFFDRNGNVNARALFQRIGKYGWLEAITRSGTNVTNWAKLVAVDSSYDPNGWLSSVNKYTLSFMASPYWYETSDTTNTLSAATSRNITNSGNARSSWLTIYITSAITTSLRISIGRNSGSTYGVPKYGEEKYDGTGFQTFVYNASKQAGSTLMIDFKSNKVNINGNDVYGNMLLTNTQSDFGFLHPGSNLLVFSSAVNGKIVHRGAYA